MSMLSEGDLTGMRAVLADSLPDVCVIQTLGGTVDANGEGAASWTNAGTVACRIAPTAGDERLHSDRISEDADWIITLPAETAITPASRIVSAGVSFNVTAVRAPRSYEVSRRVEATEVT